MKTETHPLRIAIIGAGKAGTNLGLAFRACPQTEVIRIVSRSMKSAANLAEILKVSSFGDNLDEALHDPLVDAVVIATPDRFHGEQVIAAAKAGKHILCEKPMARTAAEAEAMIGACRAAGVTLMIGFSERFNQPCLEAHERIEAGEIGVPMMMLARRCHPRTLVRDRNWLNDRETGGVLNYAGTHNIDLICWFMQSRPVRVYAEMGRLVLAGQDFTDCAIMTFRFEHGGIAVLYESFGYPDPYPHPVDRSLEILGTKGSLTVDFMRQPLTTHTAQGYRVHDAVTWPKIQGQIGGAILAEAEHFATAIKEGRPVLTPGETGLTAIRLAEAAGAAFREGRAMVVSGKEG